MMVYEVLPPSGLLDKPWPQVSVAPFPPPPRTRSCVYISRISLGLINNCHRSAVLCRYFAPTQREKKHTPKKMSFHPLWRFLLIRNGPYIPPEVVQLQCRVQVETDSRSCSGRNGSCRATQLRQGCYWFGQRFPDSTGGGGYVPSQQNYVPKVVIGVPSLSILLRRSSLRIWRGR